MRLSIDNERALITKLTNHFVGYVKYRIGYLESGIVGVEEDLHTLTQLSLNELYTYFGVGTRREYTKSGEQLIKHVFIFHSMAVDRIDQVADRIATERTMRDFGWTGVQLDVFMSVQDIVWTLVGQVEEIVS